MQMAHIIPFSGYGWIGEYENFTSTVRLSEKEREFAYVLYYAYAYFLHMIFTRKIQST